MFEQNDTKTRMNKSELMMEDNIKSFVHGDKIKKDTTIKFILDKYESTLNAEDKVREDTYTIAGRMKISRNMGNAGFLTLQDETGLLQVFVRKNDLGENFKVFKKFVDIGDILQISGFPFKTKTGELSLYASEITILTKAYLPLPEKFHGLKDQELKYRKRHLDLITNPDTMATFKARSKTVSTIRRFFENMDFIEVETPMMNNIPGGANAKPFITHHNALGMDRYMRIAPELYLKKLLVGGFEKVFEIGKNFRNEGIDHTHNPEFTSIEAYIAYKDYIYMMNVIEDLIKEILDTLNLPYLLEYDNQNIDFGGSFKRISFKDSLVEIGNVPFEILENRQEIVDFAKSKGLHIDGNLSKGKMWEELFDEYVETKLIDPTFIIDYPTEISPLARQNEDNKDITERFELFIAGREIANGFNELNDPVEQYQRFLQQVGTKDDDDEAMHMDKSFVEALMNGMPPAVGVGLGIDRLVMLFTNNTSIKDVILFPAMKEVNE